MKLIVRSIVLLVMVTAIASPVVASPRSPQAAQPAAAPADVAGNWDVAFTTPNGPMPGYLKLKKDGDKLTGVVGSQMGESAAQAEVKGKDLAVWFTFQGQSGPMEIVMNGAVAGDKIAGTFTFGGQAGGEWTATRASDTKDTKEAKDTKEPAKEQQPKEPSPSAKVDVTGAYSVNLELPNMSATPSLRLKQEGEKLTGEYISQTYGKSPLTGTVKGSDVNFTFTMSIEGNSIDVAYTGTVDKDGVIKGSVNYGDAMSGTFTATKSK